MKKNSIWRTGTLLVVIALLIGTSSCGIRKAYKAPEANQNIYRDYVSTDTTTVANIPWKQYFSDPLLQALISEGLENSYDLRIAVTHIKQAEAGLKLARAAFYPSLALSANVEQNRFSDADRILPYHGENYTLGVSSSWEADIWGRMHKQKKAALARFMGTHAYRNLIQTSLIANIANSYYTLLALDEQLRITQETIGLLEETVVTMEALKEAAVLNGAAVEQSKALWYATQVTVPDLQIQIRQMEDALCLLVGREPSPIERTSMSTQTVDVNMHHGVPAQMLSRRPDVRQAEYAFRAAFEATGAAQASLYPTISITGLFGLSTRNSIDQFFDPMHLIARIVGNLAQPIFANGQLKAQVRIAKAQQEQALLEFEKSVLNAGREVSDALYTYDYSIQKNQIRTKQITALHNSVDFTKELLKSGDANYTDVLIAEQSLLQAQMGQVGDKLQQLQATVDLYRALGGGIE